MMRVLFKSRYAAGLFLALSASAMGQSAADVSLTAIESAMAQSVQINYQKIVVSSTSEAWIGAFDRAMNDLSRSVTKAMAEDAALHEGDSFRAKLILIAWDRVKRPQLYEKIDKDYYRSVKHGPRGPEANDLNATVVQEAYRLPWEYALLRPRSRMSAKSMVDGTAVAALKEIGNPKSAATGAGIYLNVLKASDPLSFDLQRQNSLYLMLSLPSASSMEHVLTCAEAAKRVSPRVFELTRAQFERWLGPSTDPIYSTKWNEEVVEYRKKAGAKQAVLKALTSPASSN